MNIIETLKDSWSRYRRRRIRMEELRALNCGDMRRLMQDTGLSFSELVALAKSEGDSAKLLYRRLDTIGIDAKQIDMAVLRDMQRCCTECDSKALCEHELDDQPKAATWPSYCPNKLTLEALSRSASK